MGRASPRRAPDSSLTGQLKLPFQRDTSETGGVPKDAALFYQPFDTNLVAILKTKDKGNRSPEKKSCDSTSVASQLDRHSGRSGRMTGWSVSPEHSILAQSRHPSALRRMSVFSGQADALCPHRLFHRTAYAYCARSTCGGGR